MRAKPDLRDVLKIEDRWCRLGDPALSGGRCVKPTEFKQRYLQSLPEVPDDLRDELGLIRFASLNTTSATKLNLPKELSEFLTTVGLPESASPWLSFDFNLHGRVTPVDAYPHMIAIGSNSSGDDVCLDANDNYSVVYLNHDDSFRPIFINSSVPLFAECLCLYLGHRHRNDPPNLLDAIGKIDAAAIEPSTFWYDESVALENGR